jgi:hypothetical protein
MPVSEIAAIANMKNANEGSCRVVIKATLRSHLANRSQNLIKLVDNNDEGRLKITAAG